MWIAPNQYIMPGYRTTERNTLIELLCNLTADYTKLLIEKEDQRQLDRLQKEITAIQKEISLREKLKKYSNASTDFILVTDGDII